MTDTQAATNIADNSECASSSAKKLKTAHSNPSGNNIHTESHSDSQEEGGVSRGEHSYGMVDMNLLMYLVTQFPCSDCLHKETLAAEVVNLGGLAMELHIICNSCGTEVIQPLSEKIKGNSTHSFVIGPT